MPRPLSAACLVPVLLVGVEACRCREQPPGDALELIPAGAAFVMSADLARLRRSAAFKGLGGTAGSDAARRRLGFDPTADLKRLVVGAAGGQDGLDFVAVLAGTLEEQRVLAALGKRGGGLARRSRRGQTLYRDRAGLGPLMFFPGRGTLVLVSAGWRDAVLDRLEGRGASVLSSAALAGNLKTARSSGRPAWAVARLAPATSGYLATRLRLPQLRGLVALEGGLRADRQLRVNLSLLLDQEKPARALEAGLREVARRGGPLSRLRVEQLGGRRLQLRLGLTPAEIKGLLAALAAGAGG